MLKEERSAEDLQSWLHLHHFPGVNLKTKHKLLRQHKSPRAVIESGNLQCGEFAVCSPNSSASNTGIDVDLSWADLPHHHIVTYFDSRFPDSLKHIPDPPLLLYVLGNPSAMRTPQVSIVGSRNATPYGRQIALSLASGLTDCGFTVTSGLALGIDAAAHQGAIESRGTTIAVAANGLDRVYPHRHRQLAAEISETGAVVSEFPISTAPRREHFPQRNRIISGLSQGTVVVEATLKSGSLITARFAAEQNREVFAVPGPVHSGQSWGCHKLIRQGAKLVESLQDVLEELKPPHLKSAIDQHPQPMSVPEQFHVLLELMGYEPVTVDILAVRSGLTTGAVSSMLLEMEVNGWIESYAGGGYFRIPSTNR